MRVAIRADASKAVGAGHVTRCLALADELSRQGASCIFFSRSLPAALSDQVRLRGHSLVLLSAETFDTSRDNGENDASEVLSALSLLSCDGLVVDHYGFDQSWESKVRASAPVIVAIDDLANRRHDCDILLDQNYYANADGRYENLVPESCMRLLGPQYALLRPQFGDAHATWSPRGHRLFVSMGGFDQYGVSLKVINCISHMDDLSADVVAGLDTALHAQAELAASNTSRIRIHGYVDQIAGLMAQCTLAIGAGGVSTWERCAVGLPSLVVTTAQNQEQMIRDLAIAGIIHRLGAGEAVTEASMSEAIRGLLHNASELRRMNSLSVALVDGLGAKRVAERIRGSMKCIN